MLARIITSEKAMNHLIDDNSVLSPYIYITSRLTLLWRTSFSINIIRCSVFSKSTNWSFKQTRNARKTVVSKV